jgi:uncharacterized protein YbjT (DUF2867 family)
MRVAILGASGFIGSRAVELLHLADLAEVRPIRSQHCQFGASVSLRA